MRWAVLYDPHALRQVQKLDKTIADRVTQVLESRIASHENPRLLGKAMAGEWKGLWRFRVGDYRVICDIKAAELIILVVQVGHRKQIYD